MAPAFSISRFLPGDAPGVREIYPDFLTECSPLLRRGVLFVARQSGRVVGFTFVKWLRERCYYDREVTRYAEITEVHVRTGCGSRNIGTALVTRAVREARRYGYECVYVITDDFNAAARRVYEKCAFPPHNHVIRYRRSLRQPRRVTSSGRPRERRQSTRGPDRTSRA